MQRISVIALIVMMLFLPTSAMGQSATPENASTSAASGDFAGLVDIGGGRRMFFQCRGQGGPTVVLISGGGNTGGAWTVLPEGVSPPAVLPGVAAFTRVCAYDRPGTRSMPIPLTTAAAVTPSPSPPPPRPWSPICTPS